MRKILKRAKRVTAFLLTVCIVMSNLNITAVEVSAEEPEKSRYTFVCKIKETNKEISDSEVKIQIFDGENEVKKTENAYELEKGKEYQYKITSTSSKFKGPALETGDTFTAGTDEKIPLFVPLDKLNIEMGNKECYIDAKISMSAADDWDLDWQWKSDNENVAKVDDKGNVTAVGEGTAVITKTSGFNSKITASAQVEVTGRKQTVNSRMGTDAGQTVCEPRFVVEIEEESGTKKQVELDLQSVVIKDGEGKELLPENEEYNLVSNETYQYEIKDSGITDETKTGSFNASEDIVIVLKLVEPVFKINDTQIFNDKGIPNINEIKNDSTIKLECINYESLYQGNWTYKITGINNPQNLDKPYSSKVSTESDKTFHITYKWQKDESDNSINYEKNISLPVFDDYEFVPYYDGKELKELQVTCKTADGTTIAETQMQADSSYTINVSAAGFKDSTVTVVPTFNNHEITITLGDIILPKLNNVEAYYGEEISLDGVVEGSYCKQWEWGWKCVKDDNSGKSLNINDEKISLNDAEEGTYTLTYNYNNEKKESATITVKKIWLDVDWDKWDKDEIETITYDPSNIYTIKESEEKEYLEVKGEYVKFFDEKGQQLEKNEFSDNQARLIISGQLHKNSETDNYDSLTNVNIEVQDNEGKNLAQKYNLSKIKEKLEDGILIFQNKRITVEKAILKVSFINNIIPIQYRKNEIAYENQYITLKTEKGEPVEGERKSLFLKILCDLMGTAKINDDEKKCTFDTEKVKYDKGECFVDDGTNVRFTFENGYIYVIDTESVVFNYNTVFESLYLSLDELMKECSFTQKNKDGSKINLFNKGFCLYNGKGNSNYSIQAEIHKGSDYAVYSGITFKKLNFPIVIQYPTEGYKEIYPGNETEEEEEEYYQVIFDHDKYPTTVAIIHILPEDKSNAGTGYSTSFPAAGGNYPVMNLFFDNTAPKVIFQNYGLDRGENNNSVLGGEENINEIEFTVENTGFDVASIQYGFCSLDPEEETVTENTVKENMLGKKLDSFPLDSSKQDDESYTVNCPSKEGDYALYIKIKDNGGNEGIYISNGFFIDTTAPDIASNFTKKDSKEDITAAIEDEKTKVYSNQGIHAEFTLTEPHLNTDTVAVTITAVDGDGQKISSLDQDIREKETAMIEALSSDERKTKRIAECEFKESANYTVTIAAEDKVGLPKTVTYKFTVDTEKPEGFVSAAGSCHKIKSDEGRKKGKVELVFEKFEETWEKLTEAVYKIFSREEIKVTLTGSDAISPVDIYYYVTAEQLNEEQLEGIEKGDWTAYPSEGDKTPDLGINEKEIVYGKVVDRAGNAGYFCTEGMITDNRAPEVELTIGKAANRNNFYNGDILFSAAIEDKTAEGGTAGAGLQYVSYRIEKEGSISESEVIYDAGDKPDSEKKKCDIKSSVINAGKFNNNDVTLYVTAVDNAGNIEEKREDFKIDTVKPEISVAYDGDSGTGYYNRVRTATVTIKERNLDTKDVDISIKSKGGNKASIGKWSHSSDIGKSDDATYTCRVVFSEDDDYRFAVSCMDKAGNKAVKDFSDEFTIDTAKPVITVDYNKEIPSQDTYFNEPVTATITITERNFDAGKVNIRNNTEISGDTIPSVSGFSSNGDTHTATISYNADGRYGLSIEYTDEAGNPADSYTGNNFTVDMTEPEIKITNLEDKSANKDKVQPVITCTDTNYDAEQISITVTGSNSGGVELKNLGYAAADIADGQQFTMDFPKTEELDDVYTLKAEVKDKAGNTKESSIDFSVNRYGSVYTLAAETGEWLTNNECAYIKEGKPVVILETNVDEITDRNISYIMGGMDASVVNIKESAECSPEEKENGSYFTASKVNTEGQWHQCKYEVQAANFTKEGRYTIQIDSTDRAGNHTGNVGNKHNGGNLQIEFAVDRTAPSVVVTGADSGDIYNEETHTLLLDAQDNLALDYVTVYLNGKEYGTYKGEDIGKMEDGLIPVEIRESVTTQTIQVKAMDMAGNILGQDEKGAYDKTFDEFKILVTRNPFVRLLHKTWLLLIILLAACCGIVAFIVVKRKKKQG